MTTQPRASAVDIIRVVNLKPKLKMLRTLAQVPYFTSTLLLGLALFTTLLFFTEIWFLLTETQTVSHSSLALAYAVLSSVLPMWGIYRDRQSP